MHRLRLYSASLLLAILAMGGVLAPSVHRVEHAHETSRFFAEHIPAATHHHHEAGDDHGLELVEPCPEPLATDWTCVLCTAISAHVLTVSSEDVPPSRLVARWLADEEPRASADHTTATIRGPPSVV